MRRAPSRPSPALRERRQSSPAKKTLRILQWSHFVPGYDAWFDGVYTKEWGAKNGTDVIVDHMSATEINARGAAEAAARKGHDLFLFISPPAAYENQVIDHKEIVDEVEKRHGKMIPLAEKSTHNPKTGKYFAFSDSFVPDPGNYRIDLWSQVGYPNGPSTWEDLRVGGRQIRQKFGNPVGLGSPRRWTPTWRCAASSGRSAAPCRTPTDGRLSGRTRPSPRSSSCGRSTRSP